MVDISLYFHIPFCTRKCPYCHFFVLPNRKSDQDIFAKALLQEWELRLLHFQDANIVSLYFGGGTPSLAPDIIEKILAQAKRLTLDPNIEITLEANPEQLTDDLVKRFKKMGVNRLSIGIQSLDDELLRVLGRTHDRKKALDAVDIAYNGGIENITIDLMYELPHQTRSSWKNTLDQAMTLPITHLSLYNLTFEPHTVFHKKQKSLNPHLPTPEACARMLEEACRTFESNKLRRYEISAFAKEGYEAIHNTGYWKGRPFLGLGPSSFSYFEGKRFRNCLSLKKYADKLQAGEDPVDFEECLPFPANLHELLAIRLRLVDGIDLKTFQMPDTAWPILNELEEEGYLTSSQTHVRLTEKGRLFYDTVGERIILLCETN